MTTQTTRLLEKMRVSFEPHPYPYVTGGGTARFASEAGVDEYQVIKTLIMEDEGGMPMIVLMHGDPEVSTKALARLIGSKSVQSCLPQVADLHSGYRVGGTAPFATRRKMQVFCQRTVAELPTLYVNGGKRGFISSMASA